MKLKLKKIHFEFKKPTVGQWIWFGVAVVFIAFITYIVIRLIPHEEPDTTKFVNYEYEEPDAFFGAPEYKLESDSLVFELDPNTTHFTVTQKNTGRVWNSNPVDSMWDTVALPKEQNAMNSTLLLTYSTENGVDDTYDTSSYSVDKKYYEVLNNGDSIQVNYMIGDFEKTYMIPMALTQERMESFTDQMTQTNANLALQYYKRIDIDNLSPTDNKDELLAKYPVLAEDNVYVIRDSVPEYMKEKIESLFADVGYTNEDYEEDLKMYSNQKVEDVPMFNVSVYYKLEGDTLSVEIPFDQISYKKSFPLVKMAVLPYFGAAGANDKGFMFVPEGGGAIINFNNGKNKQNSYYSDIYGWDYAQDRDAVVTETHNTFPVFGMSYGDSSFITILEDGKSYAGINADVSGRLNSYNYVYANYKMVHFEQYDVSDKSTNAEFAYEKNLPAGEKIIQNYKFIDSGSYVDMAHSYGDYLVNKYELEPCADETTPVNVEIVGAVDKVQQVMGFPKTLPYELTTYSKAGQIIDELNKMELGGEDSNMRVKLSGFMNGGVKQSVLTKTKFISALGGKGGFKKFAKSQKEKNRLYIDGMVEYAKNNKLGDGFQMYRDSARFVSSELVRLYDYSPIWYGKDKDQKVYYLVKPSFAERMTDNLKGVVTKYGLSGISFFDVGNELSADYDDDNPVSREQVRAMQEDWLANNGENCGYMINGGNDYAIPYVDTINNMNYRGTQYLIVDELIPFYQMAIHGYIDYTGKAVNISPDANDAVLQAAAYGGGLSFIFTGSDTEKIQDTSYTQYFGTGFDTWKQKAEEIYSRFNKELGNVFVQKMESYQNLSSFVSKTVYQDGTAVYVNRGAEAFTTEDGVSVPAEDYVVTQEEQQEEFDE